MGERGMCKVEKSVDSPSFTGRKHVRNLTARGSSSDREKRKSFTNMIRDGWDDENYVPEKKFTD